MFLFELVEKWMYPRVAELICGEILYVILLNFIVNFDISLIVLVNAGWELPYYYNFLSLFKVLFKVGIG